MSSSAPPATLPGFESPTRVMVSVILDNVADGLSSEEIVASYPPITADDVRAALAYAAELARERVVSITPGSAA